MEAVSQYEKCRVCACRLSGEEADDVERGVCSSCLGRPEARRLGLALATPPDTRNKDMVRPAKPSREFTAAEKMLIRKMHGYTPAAQLLALLNERLVCDLGEDATPYNMEQLYSEIGDTNGPMPAGGHDWTSLRKILGKAARDGTLDLVNEQVINDFAIVFALNARQVLALKDTILNAKKDA